ncbi:MAG: hypothetical protein ACI4VL_02345 [Bacilli bacterium]
MRNENNQYKHWTLEQCDKIIEENKDNTMYYNEQMTFDEMYNMLRINMEFGEAETKVIMASLIKNGAKFR